MGGLSPLARRHDASANARGEYGAWRSEVPAALRSAHVSGTRRYSIVLDYDAAGNPVGIDIDNAREKVAMQHLVVSGLPGESDRIAG